MSYRVHLSAVSALLLCCAESAALAAPPTWAKAVFRAAPAAKPTRPSCAVIGVRTSDNGSTTDKAVRLLREEVVRFGHCTLQPGAHTDAELAAASDLGISCGLEDAPCLRKLSAMLRVDKLLAITIGGVGARERWYVVAVEEAQRDGQQRIVESLGDDGNRRALARMLVARALAPERFTGSLRLVGAPDNAELTLDGEALAPGSNKELLIGLAPGSHTVDVRAEGYVPQTQLVEIRTGATSTVDVTLRALGQGTSTTAAETPGSSTTPGTQVPDASPKREAAQAQTAEPSVPLRQTGWIVAGSGAGVALLAGGAALMVDLALFYTGVGTSEERATLLTAGQVLAGLAVAGLAVGVGGAVLALVSGPAEDPGPQSPADSSASRPDSSL